MGLNFLGSSSRVKRKSVSENMLTRNVWSYTRIKNTNATSLPNPDPSNYVIELHKEYNDGLYLIVMIRYLDCKNYEGRKVLVFQDCKFDDLKKQKLIDPHFSDDKTFYSPIARFEPTDEGLRNAHVFVEALLKQ